MSVKSVLATLGIVAVAGGAAYMGYQKGQVGFPDQALQAAPSAQTQTNVVPAQFDANQAMLQNEANTINVVKQADDGIAFVSVSEQVGTNSQDDFFGMFGFQTQPQERSGSGSGFVIDTDGHILTNYHVVEGADTITVKLHNGSASYEGKVVGTAPSLDVALIKIDAPKDKLKPLTLGDSNSVLVGQKAIAMGSPFGLEFTVTEGIVSAVRKNPGAVGSGNLVSSVIQTDAAINPGNSGGPLLNSKGQVIGINTTIYSTTGGMGGQAQSAGIGFAIPINVAKQYLNDLIKGKTVDGDQIVRSKPRLGVTMFPALAEYPAQTRKKYNLPDNGLMLQTIEANSPAKAAQLKVATKFEPYVDPRTGQIPVDPNTGQAAQLGINGDVLIKANGEQLSTISDLRAILSDTPQGQAVVITVWRAGKTFDVSIVPQVIE